MNYSKYEDVKASTNVLSGEEYRDLFCAVAANVSDIVATTLGPYGATTIIDDGTGFTYPTKDGWSCMSRLRFSDPIYNTIFGIIKQVSFNSVSTVGDGTTTAMVATNYFLNSMDNLLKQIGNGTPYRQADLLNAITKVTNSLVERLKTNPNIVHVDRSGAMTEIYKIAKIATNGNTEFAEMLAEIYEATNNPNIRIEIDAGAPETTYLIERGYRFDSSIIGFENYVNSENHQVKIDRPCKIIICDHNVTYGMHRDFISAASKIASKMNQSIIIAAPYFDVIVADSIDSQVTSMQRMGQYPNIMLVQIPTVTKMHKQSLIDLSVLTGALPATEETVKAFNIMLHNQTCTDPDAKLDETILQSPMFSKYESPEMIIRDVLGTVNTATFTKTSGYLQDYESVYNKQKFDAIYRECKESYEAAAKTAAKTIGGSLDKDFLFLQNRFIRLTGSNALIKVGGMSDIQKRCDKDALDDAILACRSAYEYGYVRGMGMEIISIATRMLDPNELSDLEYEVLTVILDAFKKTATKVLSNRYGDDSETDTTGLHTPVKIPVRGPETTDQVVVDRACLNSGIISKCIYDNSVYNLVTGEFELPGSWTVINSVQTDIEILTAMTNILSTIMSSTQFLTMNKTCDIAASRKNALELRLKDEEAIARAKAKGFEGALHTIINSAVPTGYTVGPDSETTSGTSV